jgi:signal transduction histidine kinase
MHEEPKDATVLGTSYDGTQAVDPPTNPGTDAYALATTGVLRQDDAVVPGRSYRRGMVSLPAPRGLPAVRLRRPDLLDVGIAAFVLGLRLLEVLSRQVAAPLWAGVLVSVGFAVSILFWRAYPVSSLVGVYAVMVACLPLGVSLYDFLGSVVPGVLVVAAMAARTRFTTAVAGTAFAYLVLLVTALADPGGYLWGAFIIGGAFVAGRLIYSRRQLIDELRRTTAELERTRDQQAQHAVAEERTRIARELHDVVAHSVSVMVVQAGAAQRMLDVDGVKAARSLDAVQQTGRQALAELRRLLGVLRPGEPPTSLAPQPGLADLDTLTDPVRHAGVHVDVQRVGDVRPLATGVDLAAFRIVQEALTNVLRHAHARTVRLRLDYGEDALVMEVSDDGTGGEPVVVGSGHGLIGMTERASVYGGTVHAGRGPEGGYAVRARLPLTGPS